MNVFEAIRVLDRNGRFAPKVLAADGKPLREGETVWNEVGLSFKVTATNPKNNSFEAIRDLDGSKCYLNPRVFTHERPDSWERLEEDANKAVCIYFGVNTKACSECAHNSWECSFDKVRDLVRRAKALAERDR